MYEDIKTSQVVTHKCTNINSIIHTKHTPKQVCKYTYCATTKEDRKVDVDIKFYADQRKWSERKNIHFIDENILDDGPNLA